MIEKIEPWIKGKRILLLGYGREGQSTWNVLRRLGTYEALDQPVSYTHLDVYKRQPVSREIMGACPKLKYIGLLATGYNVVDVKAAKEAGITVTNIPTYGTDAVSQYAIALLLELCHHIGEHSDCVKRGDWTKNKDWCFWNHPLIELALSLIHI